MLPAPSGTQSFCEEVTKTKRGGFDYETSRLFGDPADAFGHNQPSTRAASCTEHLLAVSCNPKRTTFVAEFKGTNFRRDCKYSWSNRSGLTPDAYDATCRDANVHFEPRTEARYD
jgi:hypothetical protein